MSAIQTLFQPIPIPTCTARYNVQLAKYKRDGNNVPVSDKCTLCKINDPNTSQIENTEHIYLECEESVREATTAVGWERDRHSTCRSTQLGSICRSTDSNHT